MKHLRALAVGLAVFAPAAIALASEVNLTDEVADQIRATLNQQGYEVGRVTTEDGLYEAYAKKDGKRFEVLLDGDLSVVRAEEK